MSTANTQVGSYSAPYIAEEEKLPIEEKHSESSRDEAAHSAPHDAAGDIALINDGNPFPEDPNAPEETNQLTVRAVLVGSILGLIVGASNVYLGLKTGM